MKDWSLNSYKSEQDNSSAEVAGHIPGTPVDIGLSEKNGQREPVSVNIGVGESGFFGVGGVVYLGRH